MDITIIRMARPNCASCGKPLESWSPYIENEECVPCIANGISDKLIACIQNDFDKFNANKNNVTVH